MTHQQLGSVHILLSNIKESIDVLKSAVKIASDKEADAFTQLALAYAM